jgi:hypothetical protein
MRTVHRSITTGVLLPVWEAVDLGVAPASDNHSGNDMNDLLQEAIR